MRTLFDPRLSLGPDPFFGSDPRPGKDVRPGEAERHYASAGFDAAYFDHEPRVAPACVPADMRASWLKGWDEGDDALWAAADDAALAWAWEPDGPDASELAEAGCRYASEVRD